MTPTEYLDAAKEKMGVESDYEFAKRMKVPNANIAGIRNGHRAMSIDLAFKVAIAIEMDPADVIADLEAQREKNEERREFFRGFLQKHAGIASHLSLFGIAMAVGMNISKALELAQLSTRHRIKHSYGGF